jgi:hypothetical protein
MSTSLSRTAGMTESISEAISAAICRAASGTRSELATGIPFATQYFL